MRLGGLRWAAVAALGLTATGTAAAQVLGIPVHNSGISTGVGIAGEVGFTNSDFGTAKGTALAATGMLGLGPFGVTASIASLNPKGAGSSVTSYGATANLKVFGGPLIPLSVTLQGGIGYYDLDVNGVGTDNLHVPLGLGVALNIPNPVLAIRPWIAPRLDVSRTKPTGGASSTDEHFGISAGIDFNLLGGLGFRAAYDRVSAGQGQHPGVFALGAHYVVKVPGL